MIQKGIFCNPRAASVAAMSGDTSSNHRRLGERLCVGPPTLGPRRAGGSGLFRNVQNPADQHQKGIGRKSDKTVVREESHVRETLLV